jgi:hypothetical protein
MPSVYPASISVPTAVRVSDAEATPMSGSSDGLARQDKDLQKIIPIF